MTDESLFAAALALPASDRAAFLAANCTDPAVRKQVEQLLAADASNPLDRRPADIEQTIHRTQQPPEPSASVGDRVGPYKLLEKIGEGGMGEVWVADQLEPIKRRVAVKLIKPGMDSRSVLGRFEAERQALAVMDHPNIAKVLDAGTTPDGRPYFVMELVKGTPITEFADARKLNTQQRLELFVPVCQAIQHAHMKGIIHRDIKPSNVLVALHDETPVPKVIDFGVAKAVGQQLTDKTIYTGFGALVGTPAYMAPEQATFNQLDVDTRADVYALGVLLYELLAGSPPIERERLKKAALDEVLRIVRDEEPPRPSARLSTSQAKATIAATRGSEPAKLSALMKGELDWIVMKALEKDRTRRYETANGFAADVQRYLSGEQVQAVPPSLGYRFRKAYRRNKAAVLATFAAVIGLCCVVGAVAFGVSEAAKKAELRVSLDAAEAARDEAACQKRGADQARQALARIEYARTVDLAYREYHANRIERAEELLAGCDERFRGWEWRYLARSLHPEEVCLRHPTGVKVAAFSPDGATVATGDGEGVVRLWDAASGRVLRTLPVTDRSSILGAVQFTPDSASLLVSYYKSVRLFDIKDGTERLMLPHDELVFCASLNPAGTRIVTSSRDRKARVWEAKSGKLLLTVDRYSTLWGQVLFDPTGSTVLVIDGGLRLWNAVTGEERRTIVTRDHPRTARFSPDGKRVAYVGEANLIRVYDTVSGKELPNPLAVDSEEVKDFAFAPDGRTITTVGDEHAVRTFDVESGRERRVFRTHARTVNAVGWSADGKRLLTASDDGTARLWDPRWLPGSEVVRPMIPLLALAVSPDARHVAVADLGGEIQLWDLRPEDGGSGTRVWVGEHGTEFLKSLAFSHDGRRLASVSERGSVVIWSVPTGRKWAESKPVGDKVGCQCAAYHPTRDQLVVTGHDGTVAVLDGRTAEVLHRLEHPADPVWAAAFSWDGRQLVIGAWDGRLRVWDTKSWHQVRTLECGSQFAVAISTSRNGRMAVRYQGGAVRVWDLAAGSVVRELPCPREDALCVAITPDGDRVATSGRGNDVHVWDVDSGAELLSPVVRQPGVSVRKNPSTVYPLVFSADGHKLINGGFDQAFRVWDATPLKPEAKK